MAFVCGRRHFVVFMTFLGMLICVGSREVFTMVITHVLGKPSADEGIIRIPCVNTSTEHLHQDWQGGYVFTFQTVYFVGYIVTQLPGGILSARFSAKRVCGVSVLITSLLMVLLTFVIRYYSNPWPVFVIRVLQGLVEGPLIPAFNGVIAAWAPRSEKSVLITISYSGAYLSAAVAAVSSGLLICGLPWPGIPLIIYGCLGVMWSLLWFLTVKDSPAECSNLSEQERDLFIRDANQKNMNSGIQFNEIPWRRIFTSLPLSAIVVAAFCRNWIFALLLTEIPVYYKDLHMNPGSIGIWSALPHVMMTVVVIICGITVDALIRYRRVSTTVARKMAETIGFGVESACFLILGLVSGLSITHSVIVLCIGVAVSGIAISGYQANPLDIAPRYCSVLTGIVRLGTVASVISTALADKLVANSHSIEDWRKIFIIAGSIHLGGVVYYLVFASGERQPWAEPEETLTIQRTQELPYATSAGSSGYQSADENTHITAKTDNGYVWNDDKESLLTRSLRLESVDQDFEGPSWFLTTI